MYLLRRKGSCPFQYEQEKNSEGKTALAGLVTYLELIHAAGLRSSVERHVGRRGVLDVLEKDAGFFRMRREVESYGMRRRGRRALENKGRVERRRSRRCSGTWTGSTTRTRRRLPMPPRAGFSISRCSVFGRPGTRRLRGQGLLPQRSV